MPTGSWTRTPAAVRSASRLPPRAESRPRPRRPTGTASGLRGRLAKAGYQIETLPPGVPITYGVASNVQDLSNYDVFIVPEPNVRFSDSEKGAILAFVQDGGGLFMIADHGQSDRNNDGWDSPEIFNDLGSDSLFGDGED